MKLIGWLLCIGCALAGLALRVQGGMATTWIGGTMLLILAALACPLLWMPDGGPLGWTSVTRRDRIMLGLALILAVPLILPLPV